MGDFNTPLTAMDRSTRQKINKETQALNEALDQMDSVDIYRTFHPKATEYTLFSSPHRTFSKIDHILGYKSNLGNFKKTEIISSIFSDHNAIQLEINNKKTTAETQTHGDSTTCYYTTNGSLFLPTGKLRWLES